MDAENDRNVANMKLTIPLPDWCSQRLQDFARKWNELPGHVVAALVVSHFSGLAENVTKPMLPLSYLKPSCQQSTKQAHWVIPIANELGYFPTERQATEINVRSATLYAEHFGGNPPKGKMVQEVADRTLRQAIDDVMQGPRKKRPAD